MPASPEGSPFIPPLPSPYGGRRGVIPSPVPDEESSDDMHRRHRPRGNAPHGGWTPPHEGWTPPAALWGQPPPQGFVPYATPRYGPRPPGPTPMQPPHPMYGASPWPGYPHSAAYGPGPLPFDPRFHTPYPPYYPVHGTPHSVPHPHHHPWPPGASPMGVPLDFDAGAGPFPPPARPEEDMIRVDKWEAGPNCAFIPLSMCNRSALTHILPDGPVLTPFQVAVLDVKPVVNPFLGPGGDNQPHLIYNLLFPVGRARRSTDPPSRSWSSGRLAPATWPRVTKLNIISREFPWVFEIDAGRADRGVTCLDVIEGLHEHLQTIVPRHQIEALTGARGEAHKRKLYEAYHYNRSTASDAPGGSLGEGVRKVDWLLHNVMYDGLFDDQKFVQEKLGIKGPGWKGLRKETAKDRVQTWPATFVLKLDVRYGDSEADRVSVASDVTDATDETQTQGSEET